MAIQQYQLAYQVSPLYLTGGITLNQPGSIQPFLSYVMPGAFTVLGPDYLPTQFQTYDTSSLDNAYGAFSIIPGGTLNKNSVAKYPFANQYVAANAIIREPLSLSLIWDTPMRNANAWDVKLATMTSIKNILDMHVNAGGLFTIATPAFIYTNMILSGLTDNSRGNIPLPQNAWRFDFERPLTVQSELLAAYQNTLNLLLSKIAGGLPTTGLRTGITPAIGAGATQVQANPGPGTPLPSNATPGQVSGTPSNLPLLL